MQLCRDWLWGAGAAPRLAGGTGLGRGRRGRPPHLAASRMFPDVTLFSFVSAFLCSSLRSVFFDLQVICKCVNFHVFGGFPAVSLLLMFSSMVTRPEPFFTEAHDRPRGRGRVHPAPGLLSPWSSPQVQGRPKVWVSATCSGEAGGTLTSSPCTCCVQENRPGHVVKTSLDADTVTP